MYLSINIIRHSLGLDFYARSRSWGDGILVKCLSSKVYMLDR